MTMEAIIEWGHLLALDYTGQLYLPPVDSDDVGVFSYPTTSVRGLETWMGDMVLYCEAQEARLQ